ncbi:MAG: hypothetical protein ACRDFB_08535 [Rhabdochlamydiaceae bacterium]
MSAKEAQEDLADIREATGAMQQQGLANKKSRSAQQKGKAANGTCNQVKHT